MAGGALVRAARQQGQRQLLAWRRALAEVQLAPAELERQQQQGLAAAAALQQQCGYRTRAGCFGSPPVEQALAGGLAAALGCRPAPGLALLPLQHPARQPAVQQLQQLRGYALGSGQYRPRRREAMPDRNLPQRNEQIQAPEVRVLFPDEERPAEVMLMRKALKLAKAEGLDVVMVSPRADPPVVRLIEWSKVLYEQQKREKAAMRQRLAQQKSVEPKEVRIGCQIAEHDLGVKMAQARRFLEEGYSLRLVVTFKGGQQIALGRDITLYLIGQLADLCKVKDEKHLQKPLKGQWAVLLVPLPPPSKKQLAAKAAQACQAHAAEPQPAVASTAQSVAAAE